MLVHNFLLLLCMCVFVYVCISSVNKKCLANPTEGETKPQCKKKMFCEYRPSEAWFPSYGLMQSKENMWNVLHELQHGLLHLWTGFACLAGKFHVSYEPSQFCSVFIVARCRSADWNLFMVHAWWCSTTFSSGSMRILERCVSETG